MATLKDIALKTGFSVSTVCYALNNDHRIPEETRDKIVQASNELHYERKKSASPKTDYRKFVVFCIASMNGVIYTELFDAIHRVLHLSNCKVMIYLGTDITNIHWMDGLIILNPNVKDKDIREMVSRKIPVVVMDREADIDGVSSVVLDNSNGMTELTRRVLAKGAKTFAFVSGPDNSIESQLRFAGFQTGLAEKSVSFSEENHFHGDFTVDSGYIVAETSFVHAVELPDAIVCANDEMALGIMQAFHDYNVDYFGKTIITGFDGSANKTHLGFITCKCNHTHWGSVAAYVLTEMFSKIRSEKIKILVDVTEY